MIPSPLSQLVEEHFGGLEHQYPSMIRYDTNIHSNSSPTTTTSKPEHGIIIIIIIIRYRFLSALYSNTQQSHRKQNPPNTAPSQLRIPYLPPQILTSTSTPLTLTSHLTSYPSPRTHPSPPPMPQTSILISITGGEAAGKKAVQAGLKSRLLSLNSGLKISTLHMADYALTSPPPLPLAGTGTEAQGVEGYDLERLADELEGIAATHGEADVVDVVIVEGRYLLCSRRLVEVAGVRVYYPPPLFL